jgi:hypothetical protein
MEQRVGRGRFETAADEDGLLIEVEFTGLADDLIPSSTTQKRAADRPFLVRRVVIG